MPNIQLSYLYRDAGNYKKFSSVIFSNPNNISLESIEELIRSKLIDGQWFYADEWNVPDLHFDTWNNSLDHTFHEFESLEYTNEAAISLVCINEFMDAVKLPLPPQFLN